MRQPRLKTKEASAFHHLYNRVAGCPGFLPFRQAEKEHFVRLVRRLDTFFTIRVVAYQVMSNHFHLIVQAPEAPPDPEEVCRRYNTYYPDRTPLKPSDPRCALLAERMRDISWYMHALQQQFSTWYNRSRRRTRHGGLWAQRFKNTVLTNAEAVWECLKYVEMNPVRARMVNHPADYRFCSFGAWCAKGCHPFEENLREVLLPYLEGLYPFGSLKQLRRTLRKVFADLAEVEIDAGGWGTAFRVQANRRVRYWVDGLVIGSELAIRDLMARHAGILRPRGRLTQGYGSDNQPHVLCSYRQLRRI